MPFTSVLISRRSVAVVQPRFEGLVDGSSELDGSRALKAGDGDAAEAAMTAHLREGLALHELDTDLDRAVKLVP